jgi:hypothetical protein
MIFQTLQVTKRKSVNINFHCAVCIPTLNNSIGCSLKKNELLEVLTEAVVSVGVKEESLPAVALVHLVVQVEARLLARVPSLALTCK